MPMQIKKIDMGRCKMIQVNDDLPINRPVARFWMKRIA